MLGQGFQPAGFGQGLLRGAEIQQRCHVRLAWYLCRGGVKRGAYNKGYRFQAAMLPTKDPSTLKGHSWQRTGCIGGSKTLQEHCALVPLVHLGTAYTKTFACSPFTLEPSTMGAECRRHPRVYLHLPMFERGGEAKGPLGEGLD